MFVENVCAIIITVIIAKLGGGTMFIGEKINKIRTEAKLTQRQFSEILGVAQQSVHKWESGQANPDIEKIIMEASKDDKIAVDELEKIKESILNSFNINTIKDHDAAEKLVEESIKSGLLKKPHDPDELITMSSLLAILNSVFCFFCSFLDIFSTFCAIERTSTARV